MFIDTFSRELVMDTGMYDLTILTFEVLEICGGMWAIVTIFTRQDIRWNISTGTGWAEGYVCEARSRRDTL